MKRYITFGLHKGIERMISIEEVESGLSCNCRCPNCGVDLIARKGEKNKHHFAHYSGADCAGAYESSIHKLAKQILLDNGRIFFPEYKKYEIILPAKKVVLENICLEKYDDSTSCRPDISGYYSGTEFWIEFCYRHKINRTKRSIIQEKNIECIEVYLDEQNENTLAEFLGDSCLSRVWINHPSGDRQINHSKEENRSTVPDRSKIQNIKYNFKNLESKNNLASTSGIQKRSYFFNPRIYRKPKECPNRKDIGLACKTCKYCQFLEYDHKGIAEILCSYEK